MEFEKVLENRKTVREYTNKKIPSSTVDELLNAAIRVPVGMHNDEGYVIVSISDEKILKSITEESIKSGAKKDPLYGVPLVIIACKTEKAIESLVDFDCGIIVENIHLKATELGLSSVILRGFVGHLGEKAQYLKLSGLGNDIKPVIAIGIGYAKNSDSVKPSKRNFKIIRVEE